MHLTLPLSRVGEPLTMSIRPASRKPLIDCSKASHDMVYSFFLLYLNQDKFCLKFLNIRLQGPKPWDGLVAASLLTIVYRLSSSERQVPHLVSAQNWSQQLVDWFGAIYSCSSHQSGSLVHFLS